jgi:hypothetical protein
MLDKSLSNTAGAMHSTHRGCLFVVVVSGYQNCLRTTASQHVPLPRVRRQYHGPEQFSTYPWKLMNAASTWSPSNFPLPVGRLRADS